LVKTFFISPGFQEYSCKKINLTMWRAKEKPTGKKIDDEYREKSYHQPSDEYDAST
jgi:hypothetical protein